MIFPSERELSAACRAEVNRNQALYPVEHLAKLVRMRLGLFADIHFAAGVREGTRYCHLGLEKLDVALRAFAAADVDAIVGLGDLIDSAASPEEEAGYLRSVWNRLASGGRPVYLVPGNHCVWSLTKGEYCSITGKERTWGSVPLNGWELILLDGCFRNDGMPYGRQNNDWKDAMVSAEQVNWLREELRKAGPPTFVFIHQRLDVEPPYGVSNAAEVRAILQQSGRVRGVFQGHEHSGASAELAGLPYTTLPGMVEGDDVRKPPFMVIEATSDGCWRSIGPIE